MGYILRLFLSILAQKREVIEKPGQKGSKAESTEKTSVGQLLKQLESRTFSIDGQPYCSLFKIYNKEFLSRSVERGLPDLPVLIPNMAERFNKREKIDFKLESGRHRSTKMWYCRL